MIKPMITAKFSLVGVTLAACFANAWLPQASAETSGLREEKTVDFVRDIKPILSDKCFQCHGPDENQLQADLRLDLRDSAVGYAIEPGDPDNSSLIDRLLSSDPDERMPPAHSKKDPLSEQEIELFRNWIEQGANYAPHWSYQRVATVAPPAVTEESWPSNEIDHFVLAEVLKHQRLPSRDADPRTLARRLSFDLTGLPPDPEWLARFANDPSEANYQAFVESLLNSEAYGERMAMYWLDLVRYADTNGIHGDNHRDHDLYRDYVINAFNDNMPFDRFTIEQLAGDLLPEPTDWQRIASGYNRLNMTTREGGAQPKEYITKYAADRVRNASAVWLGSTLGCAECHNHKYDPFTQRDFYSFAAFFSDVSETAVGQQQPEKIPTPEQRLQAEQLRADLLAASQSLDASSPELEQAFQTWLAQQRERLKNEGSIWSIAPSQSASSSSNATLVRQDDQSWLASGINPAQDTYLVEFSNTDSEEPLSITAIRLQALTDATLTNGSLSRANGNFVLTDVKVDVDGTNIAIQKAVADFAQQGHPIELAIDDNPKTGWAVNGHNEAQSREAIFHLATPIRLAKGSKVTIRLAHNSPYAKHNIGRFKLTTTDVAAPQLGAESVAPEFIAAVSVDDDQRTEAQAKLLSSAFRETTPLLAEARNRVATLREQLKNLEASYRPILVTMQRNPLPVRVLPRGDWLDESGEVVQPSTPSFLSPFKAESERPTRLDLAHWFVDRENPLVARVMVNRLWKLCFGDGLVRTPDDFGAQGSVPTHPELLDWLSAEFIQSGWDVKHMMRLIVSSHAYRQDSFLDPELRELDPNNQWLARQNRFRLDAEMIRDNALTISGLIVHKVGGPSVRPYQPIGYWSHLNFPKRSYRHDSGENQYRRGLYTYWCRTFLHPSLLAFDAPSREECTVQRNRSNTPLQALVLLNDPTYVEAARRFAEGIVDHQERDDSKRIDAAFERALQRQAVPAEKAILLELLNRQRSEYAENPGAADELLDIGLAPVSSQAEKTDLAAWIAVCRVILNLHETTTRY